MRYYQKSCEEAKKMNEILSVKKISITGGIESVGRALKIDANKPEGQNSTGFARAYLLSMIFSTTL